jgi:hypothetical protein
MQEFGVLCPGINCMDRKVELFPDFGKFDRKLSPADNQTITAIYFLLSIHPSASSGRPMQISSGNFPLLRQGPNRPLNLRPIPV